MEAQVEDIAHTLRRLVADCVPASWRGQVIADDMPLGSLGIGLDSISIVELLLRCEDVLRLPFPAEVFDGGPLTLGRLISYAERMRVRGSS